MLTLSYDEKNKPLQRYAKKLLASEDTVPEAICNAFTLVFGDNAKIYEPDTLRKAAADFGLSIPDVNFDKFQALKCLLAGSEFFWEVNTFENTILCFNNVDFDAGLLEGAHPMYLGWGCHHAFQLAKDGNQALPVNESPGALMDYEPLEYATVMLLEHGFIVAPRGLEWAQPNLDLRCNSHCDLKNEVLSAWASLDSSKLENTSFEEDMVGVQLARLAGCALHFKEMERRAAQQLGKLRSLL